MAFTPCSHNPQSGLGSLSIRRQGCGLASENSLFILEYSKHVNEKDSRKIYLHNILHPRSVAVVVGSVVEVHVGLLQVHAARAAGHLDLIAILPG